MTLSPSMAERLHGPLADVVDGPTPLPRVRPSRPKPKAAPKTDAGPAARPEPSQARRQRYVPRGQHLADDGLGPRWGTEAYTDLVVGSVLKLCRSVRDATLGVGPDHDLIRARVAVLPDRLNDDGTVTSAADIEGGTTCQPSKV